MAYLNSVFKIGSYTCSNLAFLDLKIYFCTFINKVLLSWFFSNWQDLPMMLTAMKLEHYIPLFKRHEIDLNIFSTLTDQDLVAIGINAFGARRRILLAISGNTKTTAQFSSHQLLNFSELNKRNSPFCAAPGAERSNSGSSSNNLGDSPSSSNW